jgi:predicted phage terminase large subunit-like protein
LIDKGGWTHLNLPAIAPTESTHFIGPNVPYRRTAGEPLHAAREPLETLAQIKRDLGELIFSAQYQQEPIPPEGEFVKMAWFQRYAEAPVRRDSDRVVQSWDTAMSESPGSDYSVCTTWLVRDQHFYLLDVLRERLDFPALKKRAIAHYREWRAQTMLIEDKGSGQSLVQDLRADAKAPPPIPVKVVSDKQSRMAAVTAMIEAGHVFIPEQASWLEAFRAELLQFPNGRYDDQADSLSQFLTWQRRQQRGYGDAAASVGSILIVGGHACGEPDPDEIDLYARDDFGGDS